LITVEGNKMDDILTKIEEKIKKQQRIPDMLEKIDLILSNNRHYLNDNEVKALENERLKLKGELLIDNLSITEKYKNFFY
jgi:uncharacterized protein YdcH (DUF465 family)